MQIWKLVLLGISGNLAQEKILPAIGEFAARNEDKVQIDLIGYSRNLPDVELVKSRLGMTEEKPNIPGIRSFKLIKGEYTDMQFFDKLYGSLQEGERAVLYLAVPPSVFLEFVEKSCPYNKQNIDLIIEKPFAESFFQIKKIMQVIENCQLHDRIRFCDHYLFKTESVLSKPEIQNLRFLENYTMQNLQIKVLESLGVETRLGYYNQIGALKDMFFHLFSLLKMTLKVFEQEKYLTPSRVRLQDVFLAQYQDYQKSKETKDSQTDTYFKLDFLLKDTEIRMESGKKLNEKITEITIDFDTNTKLVWQLFPAKTLSVTSKEHNFTLNLNKRQVMDHTNLFEDLLNNNYSNFVTHQDALLGWQILDQILKTRVTNSDTIARYKNGVYPLKLLKPTKNVNQA